ncbi:MAG: phosphomannomutase/phosphoglucomutase [Longimicrobiaceae bacterium]
MTVINPHIFRQYDIRGVVGRDLTPELAQSVGRAFATVLRREQTAGAALSVALGRDNRPSSDQLAEAVSAGARAAGVEVLDVGTVPTPALSFAAAYWETGGALQVTGSHNPPDYNGFKLSIGGRSLYGDAIREIMRLIEAGDFESGEGGVERRQILDIYLREVSRRFSVGRPVKVVVDCGNGSGSLVAVDLLRALGDEVEVVPLYCESDGTFPNHHPDPVVDENLADLITTVQETGADLGVALDGDADRIGAVDESGGIVRGDILLLLFGLDLLKRRGKGQPLVFDVKCSQTLPEVYERAGGRAVMAKTGHSLIKERMKRERALLAGELSGHIMFADDYYGFDDALYAACLLVQVVSKLSGTLSEKISEFPRYLSSPEIRYPATEESKFGIVERAVAHFGRHREVIDVDGARVLFGDGWGLVRASNTEPVLVARYEAETSGRLQEIRDEVESWLEEQGVVTA